MRGCSLLILMLASFAAFGEEARFIQDEFVIGSFIDPPINEHAESHYRDMAGADFNLVIGVFGATTPEKVEIQRRLCRRHKINLIANAAGLDDASLPEGPEVWGYYVRDEPSAKDFPHLAERVASLRQHRPGRLAYINLFPSYCELERLGTSSYDEHVRRFVDEVKPEVLCMDHYPFMLPGNDTRDAYCADLETMRIHAERAGIPFWNFFNTMPFGPHGDPTEAQIRWQAFASVAHGAKGVLYFCYWTPRGKEFPKGGAIVTAEGIKTHHYGHAQRTNAVLKAWGPTLMNAEGLGAARIQGGDCEAEILSETPLKSLSEGEFLAGHLRLHDGSSGLILLNHDLAYSAWPTVEFDDDSAHEICRETGAMIAPVDASPDMDGLQLSFQPGDARFFVFESKGE